MRKRCDWAGDDPLYVRYHDDEWGRPVMDDERFWISRFARIYPLHLAVLLLIAGAGYVYFRKRGGRPVPEQLREALDRPFEVTAVDERPQNQQPAPPFTTATMQQEANRKLGMSAKETMRVAQSLYEQSFKYQQLRAQAQSEELVKDVAQDLDQALREAVISAREPWRKLYRKRF